MTVTARTAGRRTATGAGTRSSFNKPRHDAEHSRRARLRDGGAARRHGGHGHHARRRAAGVAHRRAARARSRARVPRRAVRARHRIFQRRTGGYPPTLDVLEKTRAIRKLYKDPITGGDFQPVFVGQMIGGAPVVPGQQGRGGRGQQPARGGAVAAPVVGRGQPPAARGAAPSPFTGGGSGADGARRRPDGHACGRTDHRRCQPEHGRILCGSTTAAATTTSGRSSRRRRRSRRARRPANRPRDARAAAARRTARGAAWTARRPAGTAGAQPGRGAQPGARPGGPARGLPFPGRGLQPPGRGFPGTPGGVQGFPPPGASSALSGSQLPHHRVVHRGSHLLDRVVRARRVHAVGEQHHVDRSIRIDPQRRAGEAGVAEGPRRHAAAA